MGRRAPRRLPATTSTAVNAPFLILETGEPVAHLRRHGGFAHWVRVAAGLPRDAAVVCRVGFGEALPRNEGFAGAFVTGSAAMVTERRPWSEATAAWLRRAGEAGLPLFGVCYGHQLIAHAFGGTVGDNPRGREMGTVAIAAEPAATADPLFGDLPAQFAAHATHEQTVLAPPAGAVRLARSPMDDWQAFRVGEAAWGVQFHPEFGTRAMRGYIAARAEKLADEGADPGALLDAVRPTPWARSLLPRFVRLASTRR